VAGELVLRFLSLREGKIDAIGANRQRLTDTLRTARGFRLLPDDLYGVEQTIIVAKGKADAIKLLNEFIDEVRRSGELQSSVERSGVVGIRVAP
jgi:ABC-type amino acid transport substrate-binding protein